MDEAFTRLRGHARAQQLRLTDLARDVVTGRADLTAMLGSAAVPPGPSWRRPGW
ncbi:hypothetical protein [Pseudonocardia sp. 73-21]|uniref:hypothetical protein n=1 Tax=unclassified Pseudonocardia TaxID=2619320 RepID=UPI00341CE5B4